MRLMHLPICHAAPAVMLINFGFLASSQIPLNFTVQTNLMLATVRLCAPGSIDRLHCFEIITPTSTICLQVAFHGK